MATVCKIEGCYDAAYKANVCKMHYKRIENKVRVKCIKCDKPSCTYIGNLCHNHYMEEMKLKKRSLGLCEQCGCKNDNIGKRRICSVCHKKKLIRHRDNHCYKISKYQYELLESLIYKDGLIKVRFNPRTIKACIRYGYVTDAFEITKEGRKAFEKYKKNLEANR